MAKLNQDFVTYKGDNVSPIFTVQDASGVAVDISSCQEITWLVKRTIEDTAAILTKTKSGGQITFVTSGTDGKFQVAILSADTSALNGFYIHEASIKDGSGNITTVTVGRMQVGVAPTWTYDPTSIATNSIYQVRRLIGDVLYGEQQMQDEEIAWYVNSYSNVWTAAANAARALAAQFSRQVDTVQGELRTLYGQKAKNYMLMAGQLELQGKGRGVSYAYAGGISVQDKQNQVDDTDRVPPQFNLMIFDNLLPTPPVGQQVPGSRLADTPGVP